MFKKRDKAPSQSESTKFSEQATFSNAVQTGTTVNTAFAQLTNDPLIEDTEDSQYQQPAQRLTLAEMLMMENEARRGSKKTSKDGQLRKTSPRASSEHSDSGPSYVQSTLRPREAGSHHQRNESLYVTWTPQDLARLAKEIYEDTIPAVHLSLLGYWIIKSVENYDTAREYIRELSLDRVSQVLMVLNRIVSLMLLRRVTTSIGSRMFRSATS
jgi:hypothetical protein